MTEATLSLNFVPGAAGTRLQVLRQEPPWRAVRAFRNDSGEALIHLHNVSGGILGGDRLRLEVNVEAGAQGQISAVGATRVYRRRPGAPAAFQRTCFHVGRNALLEYLPETLIPFAGSSFEQKSEIHLAEGAGLIWWETLSAGRIAGGERFAFERVSVDTSIYAAGRPVAIERYALDPKRSDLSSPTRFGKYLYSTTLYVCRAGKHGDEWIELEKEMNEFAGRLPVEGKWGASALMSDGLVVRGMAHGAPEIHHGLRLIWQEVKQRVWGRPALPPRKIY